MAKLVKRKPKAKVESCLILDDVRQEKNNKYVLIGVYRDAVIVPQFPSLIVLNFWIALKGDKRGKIPAVFRLAKRPGREEIFKSEGILTIKKPTEGIYLTVRGMPFEVTKNFDLVFQMKQHKGRWQEIKRIRVEKAKKSKTT